MDAAKLLAGTSSTKLPETDAAVPAEGADGEGDALLQMLSQDEPALSAMTQEQDFAGTAQKDSALSPLNEQRADAAVRSPIEKQALQEVLPALMQEQADEIKTQHAETQITTSPASTANAQAQPMNERAAVQHAERPAPAEGLGRFEQTLSVVRDGNRLQVSLEPDGFGKLDINLSLEQGVLHARIHVADETSRTLLANHQQQILNALAREGLSVGGFSVSLRNSGSGQDGQAFRQDGENAAGPREGQAAGDGPDQGSHRGMISIFV